MSLATIEHGLCYTSSFNGPHFLMTIKFFNPAPRPRLMASCQRSRPCRHCPKALLLVRCWGASPCGLQLFCRAMAGGWLLGHFFLLPLIQCQRAKPDGQPTAHDTLTLACVAASKDALCP